MRLKLLSILVFFLISFTGFWAAALLLGFISPALPLILGGLIPGAAAVGVVFFNEGRTGLRELLSRLSLKRVGWQWALAAICIPLVNVILIWALAQGTPTGIQSAALSPLLVVIYIVALTEEIGWRGFVMPRLLPPLKPWHLAILMGLIHALYHLPLWLAPGLPTPLYSFPSFLLTSFGLGILWVWLYQRSNGSVLVAALLHGTLNAAGNIFFAFLEPAHLNLWMPFIFLTTGILVLIADRRTIFHLTSRKETHAL